MAIGVLIHVPGPKEQLLLKFRGDWASFSEDDSEVLSLLADDIAAKATEMGPLAVVEWFESTLSNAIVISERSPLSPGVDPRAELERLYNTFVVG